MPAKRLEPGWVLGEVFSLYRERLGPLLGGALAVFAIVALLSQLLLETDLGLAFVVILLDVIGQALYAAIVVKLLQSARDGGGGSTVRRLFAAVAPVSVSLIVFAVLYMVGTTVGFLLLLVPGLILLTIWSLGPAAIVVEEVGPIRAFRRSQDLVEGVGWSVFIVVFVTSVIAVGGAFGLGALAEVISEGAVSAYLSNVVASVLTAPIVALAVAVMYFQLSEPDAQATRAP